LQAGEAFEKCPHGDGGLHAGQAGAEAGVDAAAERQMVFGVGSGDVERGGIGEDAGVAVPLDS
jgi:hypothetical protein